MAIAPSTGNPIQAPDAAAPAVSDEDKTKARAAAAVAAEQARQSSTGRFVRYAGPRMGRGTRRRITVAGWAKAGIPSEREHIWDLSNDHRIPESAFTARQLDQLFNVADCFEMVDAKGNVVSR